MLDLDNDPKGPRWLTLALRDGRPVRVFVEAPGPGVRAWAMELARAEISDDAAPHRKYDAVVGAYAVAAIRRWENVGRAGAAIEPSADEIRALMRVADVVDAFDAQYVSPIYALDAEKNASAPSPNGASETAHTIAEPAAPETADDAASPAQSD